ncbi:hypothetical protein AAG906_000846 [Vitis piasezkii]
MKLFLGIFFFFSFVKDKIVIVKLLIANNSTQSNKIIILNYSFNNTRHHMQYCSYACSRRCRKASRKNVCNRACKTCCKRCHCVPPGTYGNKNMCPCYASLKTHGHKPKCP